jgi:hypothetical protein
MIKALSAERILGQWIQILGAIDFRLHWGTWPADGGCRVASA